MKSRLSVLQETTIEYLVNRYGGVREGTSVTCPNTRLTYSVGITGDRTAVCVRLKGIIRVVPVLALEGVRGRLFRDRLFVLDYTALIRAKMRGLKLTTILDVYKHLYEQWLLNGEWGDIYLMGLTAKWLRTNRPIGWEGLDLEGTAKYVLERYKETGAFSELVRETWDWKN